MTTTLIKMEPVESSNIEGVGYDAAKRLLVIAFHGGAGKDYPERTVYSYAHVHEDKAKALTAASSPGTYFIENIRNNPDYDINPVEADSEIKCDMGELDAAAIEARKAGEEVSPEPEVADSDPDSTRDTKRVAADKAGKKDAHKDQHTTRR